MTVTDGCVWFLEGLLSVCLEWLVVIVYVLDVYLSVGDSFL